MLDALRAAAAAFPRLDAATLEHATSADGNLVLAAVAHPAAAAAPRRYFARRGDRIVVFDGLPIPVHDAEQLLDGWDELELEGVFSALRIDLAAGTVDSRLDALGMAKLFCAQRDGGMVLSNSIDVIRRLLGLTEPDPLGVSSMVGFGWAAGGRTLLGDVTIVEGPVTPARATPARTAARPTASEVAERLTALVRSVGAFAPLTCGLTAGRDTRVVLALAQVAGLDVSYYTSGHEDDTDVVIARDLARELDLRHDVVAPALPEDWSAATSAFSSQTDGLASFGIIGDWAERVTSDARVGLRLWGAGGEIGRAGNIGLAIPFGANAPGLRRSAAVQRQILRGKIHDFDGLLTPAGVAITKAYLDRFVAERVDEGWRPREVAEAYYAFERVRYWASAGVRRIASATDLWSPFVSRPFMDYCWSLTSAERTVEAPHWRILTHLDPRVRDLPYEYPWRPQAPRRAFAMIARDVATKTTRTALARRRGTAPAAAPPFGSEWITAGSSDIAEVAAGVPDSPVWDFIDRDQLVARLDAPDEGVRRALAAVWWLEGRGT
jgi:asparagine synthase (glutamine-hydrolysing)